MIGDHGQDEIIVRTRDALLAGIDRLEAARRSSRRALWRAALRLEHLILSDLLQPGEEQEVLAGMDRARLRACQEIFGGFETTIENSFASIVLGGGEEVILRPDTVSESYLSRYEELARLEIELAGITSRDRVLFIGSGPFPITAIEYCRQTGCAVDCADFVPDAVYTSREVLRRLSLNDRIRCHQARGEELPASAYSVVLVGVLARPKEKIFANLEATSPEGCRMIARTTFGLRQLIYHRAEVDEGKLQRFHRTRTNEARGDQVISADLYVKRF